jgi:hypothetical protein
MIPNAYLRIDSGLCRCNQATELIGEQCERGNEFRVMSEEFLCSLFKVMHNTDGARIEQQCTRVEMEKILLRKAAAV